MALESPHEVLSYKTAYLSLSARESGKMQRHKGCSRQHNFLYPAQYAF